MSNGLKIAALVAAGVLSMSMAQADPKPVGAKAMDRQALANLYAGRTHTWKDCKAGIYYGGGWEAQAFCEKSGKAVGVGTWSVKAGGKLCRQLNWYWPEGGSVGTKAEEEKCVEHVVDSNGTVWRSWPDDADWWRFNDKNTPKGFKHKRKVNQMRKKLKV